MRIRLYLQDCLSYLPKINTDILFLINVYTLSLTNKNPITLDISLYLRGFKSFPNMDKKYRLFTILQYIKQSVSLWAAEHGFVAAVDVVWVVTAQWTSTVSPPLCLPLPTPAVFHVPWAAGTPVYALTHTVQQGPTCTGNCGSSKHYNSVPLNTAWDTHMMMSIEA